ncbi:MAG: YncE family protein, partial [candidate division WOR-3 bacterium]
MRPKSVLCAVLCVLCTTVVAQRLEKTIWVPDSMVGAYPSELIYLAPHNSIYVGGGGGNVLAIDCATNRRVAKIPVGRDVRDFCYNTTNDKVYATSILDGTVTIINAATNQPLETIPLGNNPYGLCYNSQNNKVYCVLGNQTAVVIDGVTNQVRDTIPVGRDPVELCYNPTSNKVYCVNEYYGNVTVINGANDSVVATVTVGRYPKAIACDPVA